MIQKNIHREECRSFEMPGGDKVSMQLLCGPADGCPNFAMRRFVLGPGGYTPRHQHDFEHEVLVLSGSGVVFGNGAERPLAAGDAIFIPANELHQFRNTGAQPLEFLCMVPAFVHQPGMQPMAVNCAVVATAAAK